MSILYHIHDPMCSWCWGFKPTWTKVKQSLPPSVEVVNVLGGLAPDSDIAMPPEMQTYLQNTWRTINQKLGTSFNFDFWSVQTPRRSTYPACRAVLAAAWQGKEEAMITAIQQAYYLQAENPSEQSTLENAARQCGLNIEQFKQDIASEKLHTEFEQQMSLARQLGVTGFPSLVLKRGAQARLLFLDYADADIILEQINI